jgi:hypothetical protein
MGYSSYRRAAPQELVTITNGLLGSRAGGNGQGKPDPAVALEGPVHGAENWLKECRLMKDVTETPEPGVDTFEDVVRDFLLSERRLLEKEQAGEPTTGERAPTPGEFALLDNLLEEHTRAVMNAEKFEDLLRGIAGGTTWKPATGGAAEQRDQAREMLDRGRDFRPLEQPTAQRTPYGPSPRLPVQ